MHDPVYSHGGRTDGSGGHNDNENVSGLGSYHYHHGRGPHLHPGGVCQYNTNSTNSYTGNSETDSNNISIGITFVGVVGFGGYYFLRSMKYIYDNKKRMKLEKQNYDENKLKYTHLYKGKILSALAKVPNDTDFDEYNFPIYKDDSSQKWGRKYTVYITNSGSKYHFKKGCSTATINSHLFIALENKDGCSKCTNKNATIPKWYYDYLEIDRIKTYYNID